MNTKRRERSDDGPGRTKRTGTTPYLIGTTPSLPASPTQASPSSQQFHYSFQPCMCHRRSYLSKYLICAHKKHRLAERQRLSTSYSLMIQVFIKIPPMYHPSSLHPGICPNPVSHCVSVIITLDSNLTNVKGFHQVDFKNRCRRTTQIICKTADK